MASAALPDPSTLPIASPWASGDLQRIAFEDIFGKSIPQNTRSSAMAIPAVARARNLLCSTICQQPLREYTGADVSGSQPTWLTRTDVSSPILRLNWTIDDLIFYGWSAWSRVNGGDGSLLATTRLNQDEWSIDPDNRVLVHGQPARPGEVIVFAGLHEGLLSYGREQLDDIRTLYRNVRQRLAAPIPPIDLHQVSGEDLTAKERDDLIALWVKARQNAETGGVGFTNQHIEAKPLAGADGDAQLMIEARNAAAVEVARMIGVSASRIDATAPKASLNYETTTGRNQELVDIDLALYMLPITARLSMDDVVARGRRVEFDRGDLTTLTPSTSGPERED